MSTLIFEKAYDPEAHAEQAVRQVLDKARLRNSVTGISRETVSISRSSNSSTTAADLSWTDRNVYELLAASGQPQGQGPPLREHGDLGGLAVDLLRPSRLVFKVVTRVLRRSNG